MPSISAVEICKTSLEHSRILFYLCSNLLIQSSVRFPENTGVFLMTSSILKDFFKALGRVKQIHNDVKVLLRTNQQTAG